MRFKQSVETIPSGEYRGNERPWKCTDYIVLQYRRYSPFPLNSVLKYGESRGRKVINENSPDKGRS